MVDKYQKRKGIDGTQEHFKNDHKAFPKLKQATNTANYESALNKKED